jgi:hypothetical protein
LFALRSSVVRFDQGASNQQSGMDPDIPREDNLMDIRKVLWQRSGRLDPPSALTGGDAISIRFKAGGENEMYEGGN